jgi:hypothetical protein
MIGIQWDVKSGRGASLCVCSVCVCGHCVERQVANVVGNTRPKWKVCHAMAICLALSQLRPESSVPMLLPHLGLTCSTIYNKN